MFPNITTTSFLLQLTSVTSVTTERANSALKFIKSSFQSAMIEDLMNALILMYVHKDISLDWEDILNSFARQNPRCMLFLNLLSD